MSTGSVSPPQTMKDKEKWVRHPFISFIFTAPAGVKTVSAQPARPAPAGEWSHSGGEHQKKNGSHSGILHACVFALKKKPFLSYCCVSGSSFCGRGGPRRVSRPVVQFLLNMMKKHDVSTKKEQRSLTVLVVTHSHVMKPCLILHNCLEFSFLFLVRRKWGGNFQKVTRRLLPGNWAGSCSHQRSSVTLRLSSVRLTGTRTSSSGPPPSRSMDQHTSAPVAAQNFWKQMLRWFFWVALGFGF